MAGKIRSLNRLSVSPLADKFILKGALMFSVWQAPYSRQTMDIDMLGFTGNDMEAIAGQVSQQAVEPDGLNLDAQSIKVERIKEDADYEGVRIRMQGELAKARVTLQVDRSKRQQTLFLVEYATRNDLWKVLHTES